MRGWTTPRRRERVSAIVVPTLPVTSRMAIITFDTAAYFKLKPRPVGQIVRQLELPGILDRIYAKGLTALWDAIVLAVSQIRDDTRQTRIMVLTDGEDNSSTHTAADVSALVATKPNVTIDIIHIGDTAIPGYTKIATESGGNYSLITEREIEVSLTAVFKVRMSAAA